MESRDSERPTLSLSETNEILKKLYDLSGTVHELPSERDRNYHVVTDRDERYVLKVAAASEREETLALQNAILKHLAQKHFNVPIVQNSLNGLDIEHVGSSSGVSHYVRLLTYLPGRVLAKVNPHSSSLSTDFGKFLGTLSKALAGFNHPGAHRVFYWDLNQASNVMREYLPLISDQFKHSLVEYFLNTYETLVLPKQDELRSSVIHNDANDYNVLVSHPHDDESRAFGLLDFGDMVFSHTINELAIGIAYAILNKTDPIDIAQKIVRGYHSVFPLKDTEIEVLFPLVCTRLAMSVSIAAYQQKLEPQNEYLRISQEHAWKALSILREVHPRYALYCFRSAIGLEPCQQSSAVVQWLKDNSSELSHPLEFPLTEDNCSVIDLSIGSLEVESPNHLADAQAFANLIAKHLESTDVTIGIGRYNEPRLMYQSDQYLSTGSEMRTVHLATDLFVEHGSPVFSIYDGKIHSLLDNSKPLDNGPTIIIEHSPAPESPPFYVLYSHLSRKSLNGLSKGQQVRRGEQIATVGTPSENGGWPPHLHFQLIVDMLDCEGDFFGVAPPSKREVWLSISPDSNYILQIPPSIFPSSNLNQEEILDIRRKHIGRSLGISYKRPLTIVRGFMQYLYDENGRRYLDVRNNVPQVGHSNPVIIDALTRQSHVLNTNTRYLHEGLVKYAERLCSKLPLSLSVCFFVNSGSEANELALRLARTHTRQRDIIAIDGAYHGNTSGLIDISSYKHNGPGGAGAPDYVHVVRMPDMYRGAHKDTDAGSEYASEIESTIHELTHKGRGIAAFISEPLMGCGGQIVFPKDYLKEAYRHVRAAGGVCISDEVQTGFGRVGTHFWGFETQGVVPDIVTMGKPIGNGHPIGAVVTTPEIAESFDTGMEFFSTTGGNTVSCAVGMAVLDVIEQQQLQKNALDIGQYLLTLLKSLKDRHPIVGDVRGIGLFIGVELVRDPVSLEPASKETRYIVERMKDLGVLISLDGPLNNVLKIKPPLIFTRENAEHLVTTLDIVLSEDPVRGSTHY
ncbi:MAG: aminotransferase class III-fold pyridoxal phosphate-dependent enzyme [Candidatus Thorarchaeota archaeon]|nr:aminotransferase class III-fold pyridoxal phosphate-dependent enzyme [Candidatus Thorarchaeota archaeon]